MALQKHQHDYIIY